jgi:hypothetical protein
MGYVKLFVGSVHGSYFEVILFTPQIYKEFEKKANLQRKKNENWLKKERKPEVTRVFAPLR